MTKLQRARRTVLRCLAALPLVALLAGCGSLPRAPSGAAAPTTPTFALSGRLLATDGSRRFSASLRWSQGPATRILLTTPLGQAVASIDVDAGGARLTTADGQQYAAANLSELARRGLGLALPFEQLPWWMSGHGAPDVPASPIEPDGFAQQGWTVRYGSRDALGRPLRLDAECTTGCNVGSQPGAPSGPLTVRVIIDQWLEP